MNIKKRCQHVIKGYLYKKKWFERKLHYRAFSLAYLRARLHLYTIFIKVEVRNKLCLYHFFHHFQRIQEVFIYYYLLFKLTCKTKDIFRLGTVAAYHAWLRSSPPPYSPAGLHSHCFRSDCAFIVTMHFSVEENDAFFCLFTVNKMLHFKEFGVWPQVRDHIDAYCTWAKLVMPKHGTQRSHWSNEPDFRGKKCSWTRNRLSSASTH